ncbi:hypothetical protein C8Q76DRAFT_801989 [Earliella scabrosa]|nr:hypothetical protein C8Q76DRAFT_801989 [Earliella scabrosa]
MSEEEHEDRHRGRSLMIPAHSERTGSSSRAASSAPSGPSTSPSPAPSLFGRSSSPPQPKYYLSKKYSQVAQNPNAKTMRSPPRKRQAQPDDHPRTQAKQPKDGGRSAEQPFKPHKRAQSSSNALALTDSASTRRNPTPHSARASQGSRARPDQHATKTPGPAHTSSKPRTTSSSTLLRTNDTDRAAPVPISDKPQKSRKRVDEEPHWKDVNNAEINHAKARRKDTDKKSDKAAWKLKPKAADGEDNGDDSIDLVYPAKGGKLSLRAQHPRVRRVTRAAIRRCLTDICIKNAFPDGMDKYNEIARRALVKSAEDPELDDAELARKLKKDDEYGLTLASPRPAGRISTFRGNIKKSVEALVSSTFRLSLGDAEKGQWLKKGLRYIFPNDYEADTVRGDKPFDDPIFSQVLYSNFFKRSSSFGNKIINQFKSSSPDKPHEREIPAPMLALVSTAIFAAIGDCATGQTLEFSDKHYTSAYVENMDTIMDIKNDAPNEYHALMHRLYRQACARSGMTAAQSAGPRVSFLNVKGMARE